MNDDTTAINTGWQDWKFADEGTSQAPRKISLTACVFKPGYNRKGVSFATETLERIAATAEFRPVFYHHDPLLEEGVVTGASVEADGSLLADITFDHPKAIKSIRRGVEPRFSIKPQPEQGGELVCLECDTDQLKGGCMHPWSGGQLEARGPWELAEISRTPTPAVPGTGVRAFLTQLAEVIDPVVRHKWEIAMSDTDRGERQAPAIAQAEPAPVETEPAEVVNLAENRKIAEMSAELTELREAVQMERARRLAVESRSVVLSHLQRGALQCEEQTAIELRVKDPALFDALAKLIPDNPAFSAGTTLTPAAEPPPSDGLVPHDFVALAAHCERVARETGRTYEDVFTEVRSKQIKGVL